MMYEEIDLTNKSSEEVIDTYYKIALDMKYEVDKYEKVPEMIESFVKNYSLLEEDE